MAEVSPLEHYGKQEDNGKELDTETLIKINEDLGRLPVNLSSVEGPVVTIGTSNQLTDFEKFVLSSEATRMGYVAAKGTLASPLQMGHAFMHDVENPMNFVYKAGGGALFGAGMRYALPASGRGRAIVGGVMALYMLKDLAMPVKDSMVEAWNAEDMHDLDMASNTLSGGLGHFAYNSALTIGAANIGERVTEKLMVRAMGPVKYAKFEGRKQEMWTSDSHILGRNINNVVVGVQGLKGSLLGEAKPVIPEAPKLTDLQRESRTGEALKEFRRDVDANNTYTRGLKTSDGERIGLTESLYLLEKGRDPRLMSTAEVKGLIDSGELVPLARVELSGKARPLVRDVKPTAEKVSGSERKPNADPGEKPVETTAKSNPDRIKQEVDPKNIEEMSQVMSREMGKWDQEGMAVADRLEGDIGPVVSALKSEHTPLDPGYGVVAKQMFLLAEQVKRGDDYQQVGTLFGYLRDATNQYNLGTASRSAELAQQLNLLSREIHTGLKQGLRRAGLEPDEVLAAKNPPLFTVRNDGQAGPHTIPEINNVWDVDVVLWPRNMMEVRSTSASGINGHEIGHNQYGGLLRFKDSIRDSVIGKAVSQGLERHRVEIGKPKSAEPEMVEIPGHGKVTKQELYEEILKAQANENTSDIWGASWTGPNSALSLGVLLQSLRTGGKLETRNVLGSDFVGAGNKYGFEAHGMDPFRIKLGAEVMRQRANGDKDILAFAESLDKYADAAARPGDTYTWASMDHPGKVVSVSKAEFEAIIPELVRVQLNEPLPALKGKSFGEILPDLPAQFKKMNELADIIADGAQAGRDPTMVPFDINSYTINQVFGAGMPAQLRLMSKGMSAEDANMWVNRYSDHMRSQYIKHGDPHVEPIGKSYQVDQLKLDPGPISAGTEANTLIPRTRMERFNRRVGKISDKGAPALSGYLGGTLMESILSDNKQKSYLDLSTISVLRDADEYKKTIQDNK